MNMEEYMYKYDETWMETESALANGPNQTRKERYASTPDFVYFLLI